MSQSQSTAAKYYQAVVGRREAARAHLLRQKLLEQAEHEEEAKKMEREVQGVSPDEGDEETDKEDGQEDGSEEEVEEEDE